MLARMISEAAGRGAAITERMLTLVRGDDASEAGGGATTDPASVVAQACELLSRTLGANWRLRWDIGQGGGMPARVRGSGAELESALLNIAVNARDAMPEGGTITVSTVPETILPNAGRPGPEGLPPGRYVRIAVADEGVGMDPETLARVGQPFFTTKPRGKGTGLGLASVRAFAEEAGGMVRIGSPGPGRGTTVTLWLPEVSAAAVAEREPPANAA
jgi:signal transduction histidine kinase